MGMALALCACAVTEPVVVIDQSGRMLSGTTTAALSGGHFSVTDGKLTCSGIYNALNMSQTISIPATCSDGRNGMVIATRDPSGTSGSGTIRLSDGTVAQFAFGSAVSNLVNQASRPNVQTEHPDRRPATEVWTACIIAQAEQIDDGKSDVSTIAEALRTSCVGEWQAVKQEGCQTMNPEACEMFSEKMDSNLLSQDIKWVLAVRQKRAQQSTPR